MISNQTKKLNVSRVYIYSYDDGEQNIYKLTFIFKDSYPYIVKITNELEKFDYFLGSEVVGDLMDVYLRHNIGENFNKEAVIKILTKPHQSFVYMKIDDTIKQFGKFVYEYVNPVNPKLIIVR